MRRRFYSRAPEISVEGDDQVSEVMLLRADSVDGYSSTLAHRFGVSPNMSPFNALDPGFLARG